MNDDNSLYAVQCSGRGPYYYDSSLGAFRFQACGIDMNFASYVSAHKTYGRTSSEGEMSNKTACLATSPDIIE